MPDGPMTTAASSNGVAAVGPVNKIFAEQHVATIVQQPRRIIEHSAAMPAQSRHVADIVGDYAGCRGSSSWIPASHPCRRSRRPNRPLGEGSAASRAKIEISRRRISAPPLWPRSTGRLSSPSPPCRAQEPV